MPTEANVFASGHHLQGARCLVAHINLFVASLYVGGRLNHYVEQTGSLATLFGGEGGRIGGGLACRHYRGENVGIVEPRFGRPLNGLVVDASNFELNLLSLANRGISRAVVDYFGQGPYTDGERVGGHFFFERTGVGGLNATEYLGRVVGNGRIRRGHGARYGRAVKVPLVGGRTTGVLVSVNPEVKLLAVANFGRTANFGLSQHALVDRYVELGLDGGQAVEDGHGVNRTTHRRNELNLVGRLGHRGEEAARAVFGGHRIGVGIFARTTPRFAFEGNGVELAHGDALVGARRKRATHHAYLDRVAVDATIGVFFNRYIIGSGSV